MESWRTKHTNPDAVLEAVYHAALGTQHMADRIAEIAGEALGCEIDPDDIEEILADGSAERCWECDTWCEIGELCDADGDTISCSGCGGTREDNKARCWECGEECDADELKNADGDVVSCDGCGRNLE